MRIKIIFILVIFTSTIGITSYIVTNINNIDNYQRYTMQTKHKNFEDIMYDLKSAIRDYNYRITSINRIGEAIGLEGEGDFIQANIVSFCNIDIAKKLIQRSLNYILYMPCRVAVYEKDDFVIVESYLLTKQDDLHNKINIMLKKIVNLAVENNI